MLSCASCSRAPSKPAVLASRQIDGARCNSEQARAAAAALQQRATWAGVYLLLEVYESVLRPSRRDMLQTATPMFQLRPHQALLDRDLSIDLRRVIEMIDRLQ